MRLIIRILAAICSAWLRSPTRALTRHVVRWRTAYLMEQIDADAAALRELRDMTIPRAFRTLAQQKQQLIEQWERFADGAPCPAPLPDPRKKASTAGGWSPNTPAQVGPLFQQRNPKQ